MKEIVGLVVHPNHRRRGIAKALAQARIAYAKEHGAEAITSETHVDNELSIRYHESIGFKAEGRRVAPDGDHKVIFRFIL